MSDQSIPVYRESQASVIHHLAAMAIPIFIIIIIILAFLRNETIWSPFPLIPFLNITFLSVIMLFVSILAARSYLAGRSIPILLLGCGTLFLGIGAFLAGFELLGNNVNATISIYNTSALLSGICNFASVLTSLKKKPLHSRNGWSYLILSYIIVFAVVSTLVFLILNHIWPVHFIQGSGATNFGLIIIYVTIVFFALSSILLLINKAKEGSSFRYWYSLGLGLIAVGLFGVSIQMSLGDPLNWVGRISQYLGAVYILIAVISTIRQTGIWMLPWERALQESEKRYKNILDNIQDAYMRSNNEGIILMASPSAARMYGFNSPEEMIGLSTVSLYKNPEYRDFLMEELKKRGKLHDYESEGLKTDGTSFPVSMNVQFHYGDKGQIQGTEAFVRDITRRKRAEEEAGYHSLLLGKVNDAVIGTDSHFLITYWNKGAEKIYGFKESEAIGISSLEIIRPIYAPGERERIIDELKRKNMAKATITTKHRNGSEVIVEANSTRLTDESSNTTGYLVVYRDITQRKKAEKERDMQRQLLQTMVNHVPVAVNLIRGSDMRIILVNPAYQDIGPGKEMIGKTLDELWPETQGDFVEKCRQVLVTGEPYHAVDDLNMISRHPGGPIEPAYFTWWLFPVDIPGENSKGILNVSWETTERKQLEEELRQARDNLEELVEERTTELEEAYESLKESEVKAKQRADLLEITHEAIFVRDMDDKISFWNEGAVELYGWNKKEALGKVVHNLLHTDFPEPLEQIKNDVMDKGRWDGELIHEKIDRTKIYVLSRWSLQKDRHDRPIGFLEVNTDITARKLAEEQLKETITELERSNKELQSFAYITSHDLQEPLRTMGSYAGLLKRRYGGQLDEDADDFLDYIASGATRMKDMVQGLLDYSRVGTRGDEFKEFNAEDALNNALIGLKSSIEECNAEVTNDPLPTIVADESQITRVFQNLIGNALKFHKKGVPPKIHISAKKEGNEYVFSVSDNGIGLEEQYSDRIFEVFKRLHAIGKYQGAGIGLAIVKRIIDRHGGRVWVKSEYGVGSVFYFTLQKS